MIADNRNPPPEPESDDHFSREVWPEIDGVERDDYLEPLPATEPPGLLGPPMPLEPSLVRTNMIYDPGPQADPHLEAARKFVRQVGGVERAQELLAMVEQEMLPGA